MTKVARITEVVLHKVTRTFGAVPALREVSLRLSPGDILAVLGGNGAGKSTLMRILSLVMRPSRGEILFNGRDPERNAMRARIGYLSHAPLLSPFLTARENLQCSAGLSGLSDDAVDAVIGSFDLGALPDDRPLGHLSRGQQQRVALARAFIASPDLLLLDEPTAGLDGAAVTRIAAAVKRHRESGGICVLATHEPSLVAALTTGMLVLRSGCCIAEAGGPFERDDVEARLVWAAAGGGEGA